MQISHSYEKLWPFEVTRLQNFGKSGLRFVVRLVIQVSGCNCSYTSLTRNVILKMLVSDSTILGAYNLRIYIKGRLILLFLIFSTQFQGLGLKFHLQIVFSILF